MSEVLHQASTSSANVRSVPGKHPLSALRPVGRTPLNIAVLDISDLIRHGVRGMLTPYADWLEVSSFEHCGLNDLDLVLLDPVAMTSLGARRQTAVRVIAAAGKLVAFTLETETHPGYLICPDGERLPVRGWLSKSLAAPELAADLRGLGDREFDREFQAFDDLTPTPVDALQASRTAFDIGIVAAGAEIEMSPREVQIVELIAAGLSNHEIAEALFLSINSVKTYILSAYRKMGVTRRTQAVLWSLHHELRPTTKPSTSNPSPN